MAHPQQRALLPQNMSQFPFTHVQPQRREPQRNYVFVDEKNRHRRLKVVRACEGCRRRKIKCDAANTNTWPCSACVRLKMNCIPPTMASFDKEESSDNEGSTHDVPTFRSTAGITDGFSFDYPPVPQQNAMSQFSHIQRTHSQGEEPRSAPSHQYSGETSFGQQLQYGLAETSAQDNNFPLFHSEDHPTRPSVGDLNSSESVTDWKSDSGQGDIIDTLGDLKISPISVAPYIINQRDLAEAPAVQEDDVTLPADSGTIGSKIQIPDEMMPSEQQAMAYFQHFFDNIHPYIPVVNRTQFYRQWRSDRQSISPLILEAIFANAAFTLNQPEEGKRWLALASKHEESFKDVPRLSTIQGILLLMKARENSPKRGYYYRSWMTCIHAIAMAKDLDLDQHKDTHERLGKCSASGYDCATKTRVWSALFTVELLVGGAQGRIDYGVAVDSVDFEAALPLPGLDEQEVRISQQFLQMMLCAKMMRESLRIMKSLRSDPQWALSADFVGHNEDFQEWVQNVPQHLQIVYPPDDSSPWFPFHFVANLHAYWNLCVIMHYRPQLQCAADVGDPSWKEKFLVCHAAAKRLCRLQEAILARYGPSPFLYMQRGINMAIFGVLSCNLLHLIAFTSPDPDLSLDATVYFTRHMRILERCQPYWPMPELQAQINSFRQAFSADPNQPFELRNNFPYGSPSRSSQDSPVISDIGLPQTGRSYARQPSYDSPSIHSNHPVSPPQSTDATSIGTPNTEYSLGISGAQHQMHGFGPGAPTSDPSQLWNPSKIFDQWNTAFGTSSFTPQEPSPSPQTTMNMFSAPVSAEAVQMGYTQPSASVSAISNTITGSQTYSPQDTSFASTMPGYVTPSMWQDVISSTYNNMTKRRREDGSVDFGNWSMKRMR